MTLRKTLDVYLRSLARAGLVGRQRAPGEWALYALGLAATVAVAIIVASIALKALSRRTEPLTSQL